MKKVILWSSFAVLLSCNQSGNISPQGNSSNPTLSSLPALLQANPQVPLVSDILPGLPASLNNSMIEVINIKYQCKRTSFTTDTLDSDVPTTLSYRLKELYNPDPKLNYGSTLCIIFNYQKDIGEQGHRTASSTDRHYCRVELGKVIQSHTQALYECYTQDVSVGLKGRHDMMKLM